MMRIHGAFVLLIAVVSGASTTAVAQELRCGPAGRGRPSADGAHCECVAPGFVEQVRGGARRCVPRPAGVHPVACTSGEHRSSGRCCGAGYEWVPSRAQCLCADASICGPRLQVAATPLPQPRASCATGAVLIVGGTFSMGTASGGAPDEYPQHSVTVSTYCLDRTEVTVAAYRECVSAGACQPAGSGSACNGAQSNVENHPINCVDWTMATAYCQSRGARLPTEAEWEFAARGTDGRTYPWGNQPPRDQLCWSGVTSRSSTCPVGSFPSGQSPSGVLDMAGNVWEWTVDWYADHYAAGAAQDPTGVADGTLHVDRGGGWDNVSPPHVRAAIRSGFAPAFRLDSLGFRCARGVM